MIDALPEYTSIYMPVAAAALALMLVAASVESAIFVGIVLFVSLCTLWLLTSFSVITAAMQNPVATVVYLLLYLAVGVLWSLFKWNSHMRSAGVQSALSMAHKRFSESSIYRADLDFVLTSYFPSCAMSDHNKDRIVSWIAVWPLSIVVYLLADTLVNAAHRIYSALAGVYGSITRRNLP